MKELETKTIFCLDIEPDNFHDLLRKVWSSIKPHQPRMISISHRVPWADKTKMWFKIEHDSNQSRIEYVGTLPIALYKCIEESYPEM
jgi:hypothetical protein